MYHCVCVCVCTHILTRTKVARTVTKNMCSGRAFAICFIATVLPEPASTDAAASVYDMTDLTSLNNF